MRSDAELLKKLRICRYKLSVVTQDTIFLPTYKGATLRGGFGHTFRRLCCVDRRREDCKGCAFRETCPYAYIFVTAPARDSRVLRNFSDIPRPFVIEPPLDKKGQYSPGEAFEFGLILVGKAIDYLPYFILTFKELGAVGLGTKRGKYELLGVTDMGQEKLYDSTEGIIKAAISSTILNPSFPDHLRRTNNLTLSFITPTRIKFQGKLVVVPEFHIILRSLFHRLSCLAYFHCGTQLEIDYKSLVSEAEQVKISNSALTWVDWERYSSRQKSRMKLGGFVGNVTYSGRFDHFLPFLFLGQYVHIGKNCTFGLGKYEITGNLE